MFLGLLRKMSVGKKLLNSVDACVDDMLIGVEAVHPGLSVNTKARIVMINRVSSLYIYNHG